MNIKVACIGNMNNNMFSLVRYLHDFNIDADLFLFNNEIRHFLPENDSFSENLNYVKQLGWGDGYSFFYTNKKKIREDFTGYDILIGCGWAPAFLKKAGLRLDIFTPHGSDLYDKPFFNFRYRINSLETLKRALGWQVLAYHQKMGIKDSRITVTEATCKYYRDALEALGIRNCAFLNIPMVYGPEYADIHTRKSQLQYADDFLKLRKSFDVVVFHHARHVWKTFLDKVSFKGNDIMIRGFADYLKQAKKKAVLVLFEYGPDVDNSKQLIRELGIGSSVFWMPKMARKEIMFGLSLADFGSDQFVEEGLGGVDWEVMCMGKPLLVNFSIPPQHFVSYAKKPLPPLFDARTAQDITKHLLNYEKNPDDYKKVGYASKVWFDKYMGKGLVEKYVYMIETIAKGGIIEPSRLTFD